MSYSGWRSNDATTRRRCAGAAREAVQPSSEASTSSRCDSFVTKPCLPEDLVKEIRSVLDDK